MEHALRPEFVWRVWQRRKWLAILAFAIPCAGLAGALPVLPNLYRSSAVVVVERQQVPEEFVKSTVTSGLEARLQSMSQDVLSRARLERLITELDLYPDLRAGGSMDAALGRMRQDIGVQLRGVEPIVRGGAVVAFTISYVGRDPEKTARVADTLASYYLDENSRVRERQASGTAEFLKRQLDDVERRLQEQETRIGEFKQRHLGETPEQMQANLSVLDRLTSQLRLNAESQNRMLDRREVLERRLAEVDSAARLAGGRPVTSGASLPAVDPAEARLGQLRRELAELRTRFSDRYPDVIALRAEIAALERTLEGRGDRSRGGVVAAGTEESPSVSPQLVQMAGQLKQAIGELNAEMAALKAEERRIRGDLAIYQRRVDNAPRREQEFLELSRDYDTKKELYRSLLKRFEEAQLAETLEQRQQGERFRLLEAAAPSRSPWAPRRGQLLLAGLLGAVGLAVGAVVIAEKLDTSFHAVEELRASTPLPILATIPPIASERDRTQSRRRVRLAMAAAFLGLACVAATTQLAARGNEQLVRALTRGGG